MQVKNIVVGQKYTKNNEEKTKWTTIGVMFIKDDGKMSGRIDMQPLNWDGNFVLFDKDANQQPRSSQQTSQYGTPMTQSPTPPKPVMTQEAQAYNADSLPF